MRRRSRLRPARFDELGLRRAIGDRLLPILVAAMAFLAALAASGAVAASGLAWHWRSGVAAVLTVQVPRPRELVGGGSTRLDRVVALLNRMPGVASARALPQDELAALLRPWLGGSLDTGRDAALPLPGVIEVRLSDPAPDTGQMQARLSAEIPETVLESHGVWSARLAILARSLQVCAGLALAVVAGVAAAVVAVATRAGLSARREAIEIVHGLGATDGWIARRFAKRATVLALAGGVGGTLAALPALLGLAYVVAPFSPDRGADASGTPASVSLPVALWLVLLMIPLIAALIGWATAQGTVRTWLRRLP